MHLPSLDKSCVAIASRFVANTSFVTFDHLLQTLLAELRVPSLAHLGVASLPTLDLVWTLNHQVANNFN
jgi:hypothetical protein